MKNKYAFLGVGNMASAIIKGLMLDGTDPSDTILFDKEKSKITEFEKEGFQTADQPKKQSNLRILSYWQFSRKTSNSFLKVYAEWIQTENASFQSPQEFR